ncbi:hypothetical protein CARUB_v10018655mg [Capsella rubella]|uniref:J domain-containing protein n=1 Tax=Capsella rubella TaxID=81985 RepID=R0HJE4_9BRAS|nr:dnaJ homolog subfamily C member 17 [Capsella rubella]EOA25335.1 hypothetical protein CARUB_v10018655mg [Capsella rubella]
MGDFVDHYAVLGLPPYGEDGGGVKISEEQIRKAYHCKALISHPDKNPDDPNANEKFRELKNSYDILIDPESKEVFDNLLRAKFEKRKHKRMSREDEEFWNNVSEKQNEQQKPKRTKGDPEFWKKVLEEEEEEQDTDESSDDCDSHEKETLRNLYKQVKEIRNAHAKRRDDLKRFGNDIPKAKPRFLFRSKFSMDGFVSYERRVLRRVQEAAENCKRSSFSQPGFV